MDTRNSHDSNARLAKGIRKAAVLVVVGSLVAVWYPAHHDAATPLASAAAVTTTAPDMTVYFPDRFPAPQGAIEPLPPQF